MKYLATTALKNRTAFLPERPRKPSKAVIFCKVCGTHCRRAGWGPSSLRSGCRRLIDNLDGNASPPSVGGMCSGAHQSGKIVMLWLHHLAGKDLEEGQEKGASFHFAFHRLMISDMRVGERFDQINAACSPSVD